MGEHLAQGGIKENELNAGKGKEKHLETQNEPNPSPKYPPKLKTLPNRFKMRFFC